MGNQQFYASSRLFRKEGERFDPEIQSNCLFSDDNSLLSSLWDHIQDAVRFEEGDEMEKLSMPTNVQSNDKEGNELDLFNAERTLNQINTRFTCGFKTPESHIQDLLEPAHAKFFSVLENQENQADQRSVQYQKTKILYGLFLWKKKQG